MTRPVIIAGNWKMHKTIGEATQFIETLKNGIKNSTCRICIAPPFTAISACAKASKGTRITIGAQNMSDIDEGAYTGEISACMLKEAGAQFVILGHSERRWHFGETDEHIHHKLKRAILEEVPAILCIGENEKDREDGRSAKVLKKQLDGCLTGLTHEELENLVVAYEPVWAIGTGKTATGEIAQETHEIIREHISENWDASLAENLPILYGGSVKPSNIESLLNQSDIDGALIGGASLDVEAFTTMVQR
ncbi:MAG: Triosephosphate isomerase [Chlamydiae bacterium]|nr:Triosephosphate isomerase [Chlamydiota bacterium]